MAEERTVSIDLHPMHEQLKANLMLLRAATPVEDRVERDVYVRAIEVLAKVEEDLKVIQCWHMGVRVIFKS